MKSQRSSILLVSLGLFALLSATVVGFKNAGDDRTIIASRLDDEVPRGWKILGRALPNEEIQFSIYLRMNNLDLLHSTFKAVSDPQSPQWGKFLTVAQLNDMTRPDSEAFSDFEAWLDQFEGVEYTVNPSSFLVKTSIATATKMFHVRFDHYRHERTEREINRITGEATLPPHLAEHVNLVVGISELFAESFKATYYAPRRKTIDVTASDLVITPSVLKSYYGVPSTAEGSNHKNYQAIAAFEDYFSFGALQQFDSEESIPPPNVTRTGPDCFPYCDQYESDLDIQYITAMAENINTLFYADGIGNWILQWVEGALKLNPSPLVWSISYGYSELDQCEIASTTCKSLGYTSAQYISATNVYLQQLAASGVSVMVADGDDGAPNFGGATGNCPIDGKNYCPLGGCTHTTTTCGGVTIKKNSDGELCFYPMGIEGDVCSSILKDANSALNNFISENKACNAAIEKDKERNQHFYSSCQCANLKSVTYNGYTVSGYTYSQSNGALFVADYPTSSPYVTSVGATQFLTNTAGEITSEVVCSILTGAIITTGGGFSSYQTAEDYQTTAVQQWASSGVTNPPSYSYNTKNRAYPDVSFNGHNYMIYYSDQTTDDCPCSKTVVDGTSCSSPAFAGVVSLINDQLLNAGKPQLGFLNYLLYQMVAADPSTFNDITSGNNYCNRAYCCTYGYTAQKGWDPASGLGSPVYQQFLNYVLQSKGVIA